MTSRAPFGYRINEEGFREVIPDELHALAQAAYYIQAGCTMQQARDWLVNKTGRVISVPGLLKAIRYDKSIRSPASAKKKSKEEAINASAD